MFHNKPESTVVFESIDNLVRKVFLPPVNRPYGRKQLAPQHVFVKISLRAEMERPPKAIVVVQGGDDNEPRLGEFLAERGEDFFSANDGQIPVHKRDIGLKSFESLNGLVAITRFAYYSHVGLGVHHGGDALPHGGMIVNHQYSNLP